MITANAGRERNRRPGPAMHPLTVTSCRLSETWDIDIWGQIRRHGGGEAGFGAGERSGAGRALLSAQAQLASDYFELRAQDQLQFILNDIVTAEQLSLKITENPLSRRSGRQGRRRERTDAIAVQPGGTGERAPAACAARARDRRADGRAAGELLHCAPRRSERTSPPCRPVCPRRCSSGVPTWLRRSAASRPPTRRSAWPCPLSFRI